MNKYVIKNCPVCLRNHKNVCMKSIRHSAFVNASVTELYEPCKDITDCLLKRIVELCKNAQYTRALAFINIEKNFTGEEIAKLYGKAYLATEILELLEIEEVDEN